MVVLNINVIYLNVGFKIIEIVLCCEFFVDLLIFEIIVNSIDFNVIFFIIIVNCKEFKVVD